MDKSEIAAEYAEKIVKRLRSRASGMLGMNWPLAKEIVVGGLRDLLDDLMDDGPDSGDGRSVGQYL